MAWGLVSGRVDPQGFDFEFVPEDIQVLNEWALEGRLEVTALSLATYPLVQDRYSLLPHGASIGSGYGPIVVTREVLSLDELRDVEIAVPGRLTTAFLVLGMALGGPFQHRALAFDAILDEVKSGRADAGLLIHEGQLTYGDEGLVKVLDLGEWWLLETGLPLAARSERRAPGRARGWAISPRCSVSRSPPASKIGKRQREYALGFARDLDAKTADRFIDDVRERADVRLRGRRAPGCRRAPAAGRRGRRLRTARANRLRRNVSRAVILSGVRTPIGRKDGALSGFGRTTLPQR